MTMRPELTKDSRYSWVLCFVGTVIYSLLFGFMNIFGVFFVEFLKEFDASKSNIAWMGSATCGINLAFGPVTGRMRVIFGDRIIITIGCLTSAISLLVSTFVNRWQIMFFTYSLIYGVGSSMVGLSINNIPVQYFRKHTSVVTGIVISGCSLGTLVYSFFSQFLIDNIGWRNTWRIFAAFLCVSAISGYLFKPPQEDKSNDVKIGICQPVPLWKNRVYLLWVFGISLLMLGYYIPLVYLVSYSIEMGISPKSAASLMAIWGGVSTFGRITFGKFANFGFLDPLHMHQLAMIVTGASIILLPVMTTYTWLVVFVTVFGLVDGCNMVLLPILTSSFAGSDRLSAALGFLYGACSVTSTLGPPIAGWLYDYSGSYSIPFHVGGIPILLSSAVLFFVPWARRTTAKNANQLDAYNQLTNGYHAVELGAVNPAMIGDQEEKVYNCVEITPHLVHNQEIHIQLHNEPDLTKECSIIDSIQRSQSMCTVASSGHPSEHSVRPNNVVNDDKSSKEIYHTTDSVLAENAGAFNSLVSKIPDTTEVNQYNDLASHAVIIPNSVVEVLETLARKDDSDLSMSRDSNTNELVTLCGKENVGDLTTILTSTTDNTLFNDEHTIAICDNSQLYPKDVTHDIAEKSISTFAVSNHSVISVNNNILSYHSSTINETCDCISSRPHEDHQVFELPDEQTYRQGDNQQKMCSPRLSIAERALNSLDLLSGIVKCNGQLTNKTLLVDMTETEPEFSASVSEESNTWFYHNSTETGSIGFNMSDLGVDNLLKIENNSGEEINKTEYEKAKFTPRTTDTHSKINLPMCIDENLLINGILETKQSQGDLKDTESNIMDISELAAENLAKFEEDLGIPFKFSDVHTEIAPIGHLSCTSAFDRIITDQLSPLQDCHMNQSGAEKVDVDNGHAFSDMTLLTPCFVHKKIESISVNCSRSSETNTITISELAAENLARFEEDLGIVSMQSDTAYETTTDFEYSTASIGIDRPPPNVLYVDLTNTEIMSVIATESNHDKQEESSVRHPYRIGESNLSVEPLKEQESVNVDISELVAENLAQFEENSGISQMVIDTHEEKNNEPVSEINACNRSYLMDDQIHALSETVESYTSDYSGSCNMNVIVSSTPVSVCSCYREEKDRGQSESNIITISELAAENLAQFEENSGITQISTDQVTGIGNSRESISEYVDHGQSSFYVNTAFDLENMNLSLIGYCHELEDNAKPNDNANHNNS